MGLIPQYHTLNVPEKWELAVEKPIHKACDTRLVGKPTKYFGHILYNYKKYNKRSTNYEGSGLNKKK